jgi:rhodanese-related sulfurtransferase
MATPVDARTLKSWLHQPGELALLDVREAGRFGESHLLYAAPLPYSRLELDIGRLVPRLATRMVLCDGGEDGLAALAARRLAAHGYSEVHVLDGGTRSWHDAGFKLFAGVNVPSKAFGEIVEHELHTPRVTAAELNAMIERGDNMVIVDGRPFAEYQKMNIPGGICCPNGELPIRIGAIAPDPATRIVVNCAGRTRSIMGAETLRLMGIPNPVFALENGTQGWFLAGLQLEHKSQRKYPTEPNQAALLAQRGRTAQLARDNGVPLIQTAQAAQWLADESRTTYLFDIRTPEEFAAGSLPGAVHAPGGQLVQSTDQWVGTRGARMLLADSDGVRAVPTAIWLRQMGHDASVLVEGVGAKLAARTATKPNLPELATISATNLDGATVIDLRGSMAYRAAHAAGAIWSIRPRIARAAAGASRVALIADDLMIARAAALDLHEAGVKSVLLLQDATSTVSTPDDPPDVDCIDFLFFTHGRHEGNREAALQYLNWEVNLMKELDAAELAAFKISASH